MDSMGDDLAKRIGAGGVIDAHEHLWPEAFHLAHEQDVLTLLQYSLADLEVAGATPAEIGTLRAHRDGPQAPLDERWAIFRRYLPAIENTAPIRALWVALRDLYGVERLDDSNYIHVSERIRHTRKPGLYDTFLRDTCGVLFVLNQNPLVTQSDGLLLPIRNLNDLGPPTTREGLDALAARTGVAVRSVEDLLGAMAVEFDRWAADGTVGVKRAGTALRNPSPTEAAEALARTLKGTAGDEDTTTLAHYVEHAFIEEAGRRGWPVCVHTGLWAGTWADPRTVHPEHLIPIALRHREVRFDVYHAGIPWVSDSGIMARQLPNLWLNLCWSHVISPVMARRALDEWLDVVPVNKIIGWGGDYWMALEKVYGHLVLARQNISEVLADHVCRGLMTVDRAVQVGTMLLRDNPAALYGLAIG